MMGTWTLLYREMFDIQVATCPCLEDIDVYILLSNQLLIRDIKREIYNKRKSSSWLYTRLKKLYSCILCPKYVFVKDTKYITSAKTLTIEGSFVSGFSHFQQLPADQCPINFPLNEYYELVITNILVN